MKEIKERLLKRIFDVIFSLIFIILFLPLLLAILVLNTIQGLISPSCRGPLFYKETRVSRAKHFEIYKFSIVKAKLLRLIKSANRPIKEFTVKPENLTPVGYILSRLYIDEVPQLFNILKGDMSLVGPRPLSPKNYENGLRNGIVSAKYIKGGLFGFTQSTKGHPELYEAIYKMATGQNIGCRRIAALDRLYLKRYEKSSAVGMLLLDMWIIYRCMLMILQAKGL